MRKQVAIDTEMIPTNGALVPTTHTHPLHPLHPRPLVPGRYMWEGRPAREAVTAPASPLPRHLHPIPQREEVMITPRQMRRQNKRQSTSRTLARQRADLGTAPRTQVAAGGELGMAGAEAGERLDDARREAHHEQARGRLFLRARDGRCGDGHHQLAEVLLVQRDAVDGVVAVVGLGAQLAADGHLRRQPDHANPDLVRHQGVDGLVDVARVGAQEGAEDD